MASLYPGALDTNDSLYVAINNAFALLGADVDSNAATLVMTVPLAAPPTGVVTIKGEAIKYAAKTAGSLTGCTRGFDGTAKAGHFRNDEVDFGPVADHHNVLVQAVQSLEAKLGTGATISGAQLGNATVTPAKMTVKPKILANGVIAGPYPIAFTFTPQLATSDILIGISGSFWASVAGLKQISYNLDGGADTNISQMYFNQLTVHGAYPTAWVKLSALTVALHTINIKTPTAGSMSDINDSLTYSVVEYV